MTKSGLCSVYCRYHGRYTRVYALYICSRSEKIEFQYIIHRFQYLKMDSNDEYEYEYLETENEIFDKSSDQVASVIEDICVENKIQDDLDLIAFVESNPRLYAKRKTGYRNVQEKDMAWVTINKTLKHPISGTEAKHRWDTLRNLYGRARREILALAEQQDRSSSGRDNMSYETLLTPQSMAIHRFMGHLYVPRKTVSNYAKSLPVSCSSTSNSDCRSKLKPYPKPSLIKSCLRLSESEKLITLKDSPVDPSILKQNFIHNVSKDSENSDDQKIKPFIVPKSDIKKRKKTDTETETECMIKESSQAIVAACSALPTLVNSTTLKTEEDKSMVKILSHRLKRVPEQQKTKCLIKLLEILESFQQAE